MASIFIDGMKNKPVPALSSSTAKLSKVANSTKTSPSKILTKTNKTQKTLRNKPGNMIHKEIAADIQDHLSQSSESDDELPEIDNKSYKLLN